MLRAPAECPWYRRYLVTTLLVVSVAAALAVRNVTATRFRVWKEGCWYEDDFHYYTSVRHVYHGGNYWVGQVDVVETGYGWPFSHATNTEFFEWHGSRHGPICIAITPETIRPGYMPANWDGTRWTFRTRAIAWNLLVAFVLLVSTAAGSEYCQRKLHFRLQFGVRIAVGVMVFAAVFLALLRQGVVGWDDLLYFPIGLACLSVALHAARWAETIQAPVAIERARGRFAVPDAQVGHFLIQLAKIGQ